MVSELLSFLFSEQGRAYPCALIGMSQIVLLNVSYHKK